MTYFQFTLKLTAVLLFLLTESKNVFGQSLFVNEAQLSNSSTISDNFNEFDDWIEIYNGSSSPINLDGYYLTDDSTDLNKFKLINVGSIAAYDHLIIWADDQEVQGSNHANFKLSDEESIFLVQTDGATIESELHLPDLGEDESYGGVSSGSSTNRIFTISTPNAPNQNSTDVEIIFSKDAGYFTSTFNLTLSTALSNGNLRFTTDGSEPTSSSTVYSSPISIANSTMVKAKFFFSNNSQSLTKTMRYVKMTSAMSSANSDLPIIMIETDGQLIDRFDFKNTFWSIVEPNNNGRSYGSNSPTFSGKVAMRVRGASSKWFSKKQWRVELRDENDNDKAAELLGMPKESDWVLYGPGRYDRALINNPLMYHISNEQGKYAPRTRFVEVYFNDNGGNLDDSDYWGIYVLTEKIKVDKNRVDIEKIDSTQNSSPEIEGGYILSLDRGKDFSTPYTTAHYTAPWTINSQVGYSLSSPDNVSITTQQESYITNTIAQFENALTSNDWLHPSLGYKNFTDIDTWTSAHIIKALAKEVDGFFLSTYFSKDRGSKLKHGPVWDFDRTMGSVDKRTLDPIGWDTGLPGNPSYGNVYYWKTNQYKGGVHIKNMVNDPDYETEFIDKWFDWRKNGALKTSRMNQIIDSMASMLTESAVRNANRWGTIDTNYTARYGGFQGEINNVKNWLSTRSTWIDGELLGPPMITPNAGQVSQGQVVNITSSYGGTIYFTDDGSDPRQSGGAVSSTATAYTSSFPLNTPGLHRISARIKLGANWGAICTMDYYIYQDLSKIVINEIHYNPNDSIIYNAGNNPIDTLEGSDLEFIELKNNGNQTINLFGLQFVEGVKANLIKNASIAPQGFFILASDSNSFYQQYGFFPNAVYAGNLSNSGEFISLIDPLTNIIDSLSYDDSGSWSQAADYGSSSLALLNSNLNNSIASNWSIQSMATTPMQENVFSPNHVPFALQINEIQYHDKDSIDGLTIIDDDVFEFIELKNVSNSTLDVSDYFFSRGVDYEFPTNTLIPPAAFYIIAKNSSFFNARYNQLPDGEYEGKLKNSGEEIWLHDGNGTLIDVVEYDDAGLWDSLPDGSGYSLALLVDSLQNEVAQNWFAQKVETTIRADNVFCEKISLTSTNVEICAIDGLVLNTLEQGNAIGGNWTLNNSQINIAQGAGNYIYNYDTGNRCESKDSVLITLRIPDYSISAAIAPSAIVGPQQVRSIFSVSELNGKSNCEDIFILMPKDISRFNFAFNSNASQIGGVNVQNSDWQYFSSNPSFHVWQFVGLDFGALGVSQLGFIGNYNPNNTDGQTSFTIQIFGGSGGETNSLNNADSESLLYFK